MIRIIDQINVKENMTILILDSRPPSNWKKYVRIEGYPATFETDIVYDLPRGIGLSGSGDFVGKEITFI